MIRLIYAEKNHKKQGLGNFVLKGTIQQRDAAWALYSLLESKEQHDLIELLPLKHRLYDALLRCSISADDPISCPTDQMLFLSSVRPYGNYCIPSELAALVTWLRLCFRCTFMHIGRLSVDGQEHYTHWEVVSSDQTHFNRSSDATSQRPLSLSKDTSSNDDSDTDQPGSETETETDPESEPESEFGSKSEAEDNVYTTDQGKLDIYSSSLHDDDTRFVS